MHVSLLILVLAMISPLSLAAYATTDEEEETEAEPEGEDDIRVGSANEAFQYAQRAIADLNRMQFMAATCSDAMLGYMQGNFSGFPLFDPCVEIMDDFSTLVSEFLADNEDRYNQIIGNATATP